jgi:hypothetical protein
MSNSLYKNKKYPVRTTDNPTQHYLFQSSFYYFTKPEYKIDIHLFPVSPEIDYEG